jgi:cysteine-rich CPCC protein
VERQENQYPCPCCGFLTLDEKAPGTYDICSLCGWEDDRVQFDNPLYRGGANHESLVECRLAFFSSPEASRLVKEKVGPPLGPPKATPDPIPLGPGEGPESH